MAKRARGTSAKANAYTKRRETPVHAAVAELNAAIDKLEQVIWKHGLPVERADSTPQGRARRAVIKAMRKLHEVQT